MRTFLWIKKLVSVLFYLTLVLFIIILLFLICTYSGFIDADKMESYLKYREKFVKKGKGKNFQDAVQKCDQFLENPSVCVVIYN